MNPPARPRGLASALAIARRDLLEFVRDRRTLVISLLLPMATYPILALSTALALRTATQEIETRTAPASVHVGLGGPEADRLAETMRRTWAEAPPGDRAGWPSDVKITTVRHENAEPLLDSGVIDVWIDARDSLVGELEATGSARLPARVSANPPANPAARQQFEAFARAVGRTAARDRVRAAGLPVSLLEPVRVEYANERGPAPAAPVNVASTLAGGVLVLLTVLTLTGAFYPAIDAIAGEKERGTIETLLIAPCRLDDVVGGKFLAVVAITLATLVANAVSIAATAAVAVRYLPAGMVATPPAGGLGVAVVATVFAFGGMAALAAATCLAVTTASKSGKEAQNTLTPVILLVSAMAGAAVLPGIQPGPLLAAVPFAGQIAVARSALGTGTTPPATAWTVAALAVVSLASSAIVTRLLLWLTAATLADEDVLFRGPDVAGSPLHRPAARPRPSVVQALVPLVVGFAGLWYAQGLAVADVALAIPIHQIAAAVAPLGLMLWWQRVDLRGTFAWRRPGRGAWTVAVLAAAALVGAGLFVIGAAVLLAVRGDAVSPAVRQLSARLVALVLERPWWLAWTLIAILPAVCEELLFRGWVLAGLLGGRPSRARIWVAVVIQAAAFALFHLLPERMPQTFVLGVVLGMLVVFTRSLLPAVVCHVAHNSVPLGLVWLAGADPDLRAALEADGSGAMRGLPGPIVGAAILAAAVGCGLLVAAARRPGQAADASR